LTSAGVSAKPANNRKAMDKYAAIGNPPTAGTKAKVKLVNASTIATR
jgi:hypothetical protein